MPSTSRSAPGSSRAPSAWRPNPRGGGRASWCGWTRPAASSTRRTTQLAAGRGPRRSTSARPANGCSTTSTSSQEHIREVRESLPRGYYRRAARAGRAGRWRAIPRVYEIAITLISHTEARIDARQHRPLRRRVPGGRAAAHRRAVGDAGDAAARPDRERAPHGAAHGAAARRGGSAPTRGPPAPRRRERGRRPRRGRPRRCTSSSASPPPLTPTSSPGFLQQLRSASGAFPPLVGSSSGSPRRG